MPYDINQRQADLFLEGDLSGYLRRHPWVSGALKEFFEFGNPPPGTDENAVKTVAAEIHRTHSAATFIALATTATSRISSVAEMEPLRPSS